MSLSIFKENFEASLLNFASLPSSRLVRLAGGIFLYASGVEAAGENWLWTNKNLSKKILDEAIKEFTYMNKKPVPFVMPVFDDFPADMEVHVCELGLKVRGNFVAMAKNISEADGGGLPTNDAQTWAQTCWRGFGSTDAAPEEFCEFAKNAVLSPNLELFLGYHEEKAVSTAMVSYSKSAAGFFYLSVVPEMRGRGFGAAMMNEIMNAAHKARPKREFMTLLATPAGVPLYKKSGFRQIAQIPIRSFSEDIE